MTITAQRLLTELGRRAWSGFNADDMVFASEDCQQALAELNFALRYLINVEDFPFRSKETSIETSNGESSFKIPEGQITSIYNTKTYETLQFIGDSSEYDKEVTGKPSAYWIDYNNPKLKGRLYPVPDDNYTYNIVYNAFAPILSADGKTRKFELTDENDFINMPSHLEFLFMDCLVLRTIITNMKDEQDENYRPTIEEFNEAWRLFKKACKPVKIKNRVVWTR